MGRLYTAGYKALSVSRLRVRQKCASNRDRLGSPTMRHFFGRNIHLTYWVVPSILELVVTFKWM